MSYDSIDLYYRKKRVPYFNLINKSTEKKRLKKKFIQFNTYLSSYGLSFDKIEISNKVKEDFKLNIVENPTAIVTNNNKVAICQTARDIALMSERSYSSFRKILNPIAKLPSLRKCNIYKKRVNRFWIIGHNKMGSFIKDPISKIKFICQKYLDKISNFNPPEQVKDNTFKILISGDGVNITNTHLKILNFTFSLTNDGDLSRRGFYTLGIFKTHKESYENIKTSLKELLLKLEEIKEIVLNNTTYRITFLAGGDLKWLSEVFGINAANSLYPCPWCTWKVKKEISETDLKEKYTIHGRSHEKAQICINNKDKTVNARQGYAVAPLFKFIEFERIVVDILHMTLRITDKLIGMLLLRLEELEESKSTPLTKIFKKFLEIECNITFPFFTKETVTGAKLKLRKFNQNERLKLFDKLFEGEKSLTSIFPENFQTDTTLVCLNRLFFNFREILAIIKRDNSNNFDKNGLIVRLRDWLSDFIIVEPKITPYIHIFCFHVPEFIEVHGDLNLFSMQGLEHLNHFSKVNYFRQTNHNKNTFTSTLLEKMNRIEFIHLGGKLNDTDEDEDEEEEDEESKHKYDDIFDFLKV